MKRLLQILCMGFLATVLVGCGEKGSQTQPAPPAPDDAKPDKMKTPKVPPPPKH